MATIIGVHGLANKPPKAILADWWKTSIDEGLKHRHGIEQPAYDFRMVYWADKLYPIPLHQDPHYVFDAYYNEQPYIAAAPDALEEKPESLFGEFRTMLSQFFGSLTDRLYDIGLLDPVGEWFLKRVSILRDLRLYYGDMAVPDGSNKRLLRDIIKDELKEALKGHISPPLMLIGHSMGSIIAYDVLRDIGRLKKAGHQDWNDFQCDFFVTIGSPLGLGMVKDKTRELRTYDPERHRIRTPTVVSKDWKNFSDARDPVCFDTHLRDDYKENAAGIRVIDDSVNVDYVYGKPSKSNPHKSYGYLRTPEVSDHVARFLDTGV